MKKVELLPLSQVKLNNGLLKDKQQLNGEYLLGILNVDTLLAPFYKQAKIHDEITSYGGWEVSDIAGHSAGHYLSSLANYYAATGEQRAFERVNELVTQIGVCQKAHGDGYAGAVDKICFEKLKNGEIEVSPFALNGIWVPLYNIHKIFAGLRDAYRICGNQEALEIAIKFAEYLKGVWAKLSDAECQEILKCEHGGMCEVMVDLALDSHNDEFAKFAQRAFFQNSMMNPLIAAEDKLNGLHGNTLIPKVIGLAKLADYYNNESYRNGVKFFFSQVVNLRSFANGGHGESEHFFPIGSEHEHLTPYTAETCNSYNMIKLAEIIFEWNLDAKIMNFVERVLLNHVVANVGKKVGEFGYFLNLGATAVKVFSTPRDSFWCCVGTGMESPTRYGKTFFAIDELKQTLFINHYFASSFELANLGMKLNMESNFPNDGKVKIRLNLTSKHEFTLKFRQVPWSPKPIAKVNGEVIKFPQNEDNYLSILRVWNDNDVIEIEFFMSFYYEKMQNSNHVAFFYGPNLLAGVLDKVYLDDDVAKMRFESHLKARGKTDEFPPCLIADNLDEVVASFAFKNGEITLSNEFVKADSKLKWKFFHQVYEEHYGVYLQFFTPVEWLKCEENLRKKAEEILKLAESTIDEIALGYQQSEVEHKFIGTKTQVGELMDRKYRQIDPEGSISYQVDILPNNSISLEVEYWGSEWTYSLIAFAIDGVEFATQQLRTIQVGEWCHVYYSIPNELTRDKSSVTLQINHKEQGRAQIFHLRLLHER